MLNYPLVCTHINGDVRHIAGIKQLILFFRQFDTIYCMIHYGRIVLADESNPLFENCRNIPFSIRDHYGVFVRGRDIQDAMRDFGYDAARNIEKCERREKMDLYFRDGPVWGIGKRSKSGRRYRPDGLMREYSIINDSDEDEDGNVYKIPGIRAKRHQTVFSVMDWDGLERSDWRNRNWKRHRKTQWKEGR